MTPPGDKKRHEQLQKDLRQLRLNTILEQYSEVLDEAARKNTSMLDTLCLLIGARGRLAIRASDDTPHRPGPPAETEGVGGVSIRAPEEDSQAEGPSAVRLRIREQASVRSVHWRNRHWQNASAHGIGLCRVREGDQSSIHSRRGHDQRADDRSDQWHARKEAARVCTSRPSPPR